MCNEKRVIFTCTHCGEKSYVDYDVLKNASMEKNVLLRCINPSCKALNLTDKSRVENAIGTTGAQACECIKFTGGEAKLPRGKNIFADGTVVYGTGDDTEELTREAYILKYGIDPEITLQRMWEGRIKPPTLKINPGHIRPPIKVLGAYTAR